MDRTEGAKKIPVAGGRGSRPSITISKLASSARNRAGREQSDLLVGSKVEGSGQGHTPERATRTDNERKLQACQENFDRAFSAPFRPARRGGNEGAGLVLSGRAPVREQPVFALKNLRRRAGTSRPAEAYADRFISACLAAISSSSGVGEKPSSAGARMARASASGQSIGKLLRARARRAG
jgi:hypothetical protein